MVERTKPHGPEDATPREATDGSRDAIVSLDGPCGIVPDAGQIAIFLDVVFGYCDGWVPLRSFPERSRSPGRADHGRAENDSGQSRTLWIGTGDGLMEKTLGFARQAAREGKACYAVPGTVAGPGKARAADIRQMQTILADLDTGDIPAKLKHLVRYLGGPALIVASGGRTPEGYDRLHVWWRLSEPAEGDDIALVCRLRGDIAVKVAGDSHFRSAHQPIRVAGTVYHKHGHQRLVQIREHRAVEVDLADFAERVADMPPLAGAGSEPAPSTGKPSITDVLTTPVREGGEDGWTRFQGASAAIGHYVRMLHEGRMSRDEAWEAVCQYNSAMLRPPWALERLREELNRLLKLHEERHGPALERIAVPPMSALPVFTLGAMLDDASPMPDDIIAPRLLTRGGMMILGGAPKVGKSDFLISLLVHMAAGVPFLGFAPSRPLRVFYLQAEIQYHYLRERLQSIRIDPALLAAARDNLIATPKVRMLLDAGGVGLTVAAVRAHYGHATPDILCIDPIRNLFDGGPDGGGENDNTAMMFFLQKRIEALREAVNPDAGVILCHHTRKITRKQLMEDPFMALSGAGSLRSFYTSGMIMHRPDEDRPERMLHFELRNGPGIEPMIIGKQSGNWVEIKRHSERLVRKEAGAKLDAERGRKRDVILQLLFDEAKAGHLYSSNQFAEAFENQAGLGGKDTIRERISVLATKGFIRFVRDGAPFGLPTSRSKFGYLCVEGMTFPAGEETADPITGETVPVRIPVLPSTYKCPQSGAALPVENPLVWVYQPEETS